MSVKPNGADTERPISIAVVAMGGQGGGVLADWIAGVAEAEGYVSQVTSVPGVAQRTGATIYYVEIVKRRDDGRTPVLALMPVPGDVDIVVASELMEAGRAVLRGLVTPDRTTLIASSRRAYAVAEKEKPGDGTADSGLVYDAAEFAARRRIVADFAALAERTGSVISASLFGALAGSRTLPFGRDAFERAIRASGVGVEASLRAFAAGFDEAERGSPPERPVTGKVLPDVPASTGRAELDALLTRLRAEVPPPAQKMAYAGLKHVVDFQDPAYGREYLDMLGRIVSADRAAGGEARAFALTTEVARQLGRAMAYDDVIRVADLKTRASRRQRVEQEVGVATERQVLQTTEYFHPRMEEVCATLPARLGRAIECRPRLFRALDRLVDRGRRVRTDTIWGYLQLHVIASRKAKRRGTLRHGREMTHIQWWLDRTRDAAPRNYELALELAMTRRLIKGYSDTMSRGLSKYDRVHAGAEMVAARPDAAAWVRRLRQAALMDEGGLALDGALKTIASLDAAPGPQNSIVEASSRS